MIGVGIFRATARTISTKGKIFTLPSGESSQHPLNVIILDWRNYNKYYTGAYNAQKPEPPACYAIHSVIAEMKPGPQVKRPSNPDCATCTFNKFGSAMTGRGKACKNTIRLAVTAGDFTIDTEPMLLNVSPTGITSWSNYMNGIIVMEKHPVQFITEITFDVNQSYPKLQFKVGVPNPDLETAWAIRDKAQVMLEALPHSDND